MKIKDANLINNITGTEKVPVSAGTGAPATVSLDQIKEYVTSDGVKVDALTSWEGYDEATMGEYALSAKLGYEFFSEFESINSLLDEVNGVTVEMINEINGEII